MDGIFQVKTGVRVQLEVHGEGSLELTPTRHIQFRTRRLRRLFVDARPCPADGITSFWLCEADGEREPSDALESANAQGGARG